jgi:hypothetical protein
VGGLVVWVLTALLVAAPYQLTPVDVAATLRQQGWSAEAAAEYATTVPVDVVPGLRGRAGEYQPAGAFGPARIRVFMNAPYAIEHEMHHAWDADIGVHDDPVRSEADLRRLAAEGGPAGEVAQRIIARSLSDWTHYNHGVIDGLGHDARLIPAWYRARYFGYLAPLEAQRESAQPVRYRLVLPAVSH